MGGENIAPVESFLERAAMVGVETAPKQGLMLLFEVQPSLAG